MRALVFFFRFHHCLVVSLDLHGPVQTELLFLAPTLLGLMFSDCAHHVLSSLLGSLSTSNGCLYNDQFYDVFIYLALMKDMKKLTL